MKYKPDKYYREEYLKIAIVMIPLLFILFKEDGTKVNISPLVFIILLTILGEEYSYIFPRRAMELYENILFRTFSKNLDKIIEVSVLGVLAVVEFYYISKGNPIPFLIIGCMYLVLNYGFKSQSLVIGDKNIIVGKRLVSNFSIKSISFESKKVIIKTNERDFEISNWLIKKRKFQLEKVAEKIICNK